MRRLRAAVVRLGGLLGFARSDADITEELQSHLDLLVHEYRTRGLSEAEARRAAAAKFGSLPSAAEAYRDRRGIPSIEEWIRDCRYAARSLSRTRILSASMILVLALGIGLTTTIATLFHAIVYRSLPVPEPDSVVKLSMAFGGEVNRTVNGNVSQFSYPELVLYADSTRALSGVAGFRHEVAGWRRGGDRVPLNVSLVTGHYFDVLQIHAAQGRMLTEADARRTVAVISHRFWKRGFGSDPAVLGTAILIDRATYTIVGVADRPFAGTEGDAVDVWLPLEAAVSARGDDGRLSYPSVSWLQVVGRVAKNATFAAATAEAALLAGRFDVMHPGQRTTVFVTEATALDAALLQSGNQRKVLGVGAGALSLALVLLLVCASNAAGLLLARGAATQRDIALRIALGASRRRIVQQFVAESALVASAAAGLGVAVCTIALRTAAHGLPTPDYFEGFVPDATVLWFTLASTLVAALLFAIAPAIQAIRVDPLPILKQEVSSIGGGLPAARLRHWLVAMQVAVSLVLLVASAHLARGITHALSVNTGFSTANLYTVTVDVPPSASTRTDRAALIRRLSLMLHSAGNNLDVGLAAIAPFSGRAFSSARTDRMAPLPVQTNVVDPRYFAALAVTPLVGRIFERDDRPAVVINERLARAFWGDARAALGRTVEFLQEERSAHNAASPTTVGGGSASALRTGIVIGVVPTLQSTDVGLADGPTIYTLAGDNDLSRLSLLVRSRSRQPLQQMVNAAVQGSDASGAVVAIDEKLASRTAPARIAASIAVLIGLLALLVASVGIYGVVSHSVIARTHEIGVHVALGAPRARVLMLVLATSFRAIATGACLGAVVILIVALVASGAFEPMLFGVRLIDPFALSTAIAFVAVVTVSAAYFPARRVLGLGPLDALRRI